MNEDIATVIAPRSTEALNKYWDEYVACARKRLDDGCLTYGDRSYEMPLAKLVAELKMEANDLTGWGFLLFARLSKLEEYVRSLEGQAWSAGA